MIIYPSLSLAAKLESILKSRAVTAEGSGIFSDDLQVLAELGCPLAIGLQSNWTVKPSTTVSNQYANGIGRGKRLYSSDVKMLVPTEVDEKFTFEFHADLLVDFAAKEATLTTSIYRFRGERYKFAEHHEYKPTIHDYMYAIGSSSPALTRWVNSDEKILPKVRRYWFRDFAPSRLNGERK